jgi:hypothetical protein
MAEVKRQQSSDPPVIGESLLCVFDDGWPAIKAYEQAKAH